MIPKVIHYCWFGGGDKPKLVLKCIESWKKYCPDYEIIEWNEINFDVNQLDYTKFCYDNKCYAFLSDYVRLWAVFNHGGIYLDTDVELIKSPEELLEYPAFFAFEGEKHVTTGLGFGGEAGNSIVKKMMEEYELRNPDIYITDYKKNHKMTGSPKMNTAALLKLGLNDNGKTQFIEGAAIFSNEFFCPFNDITGEMNITEKTYSIHWYGKSPHGKFARVRSKLTRPIHRIQNKLKRKYE